MRVIKALVLVLRLVSLARFVGKLFKEKALIIGILLRLRMSTCAYAHASVKTSLSRCFSQQNNSLTTISEGKRRKELRPLNYKVSTLKLIQQ